MAACACLDLYGLLAVAPEPERYDDGVVAQMFGTGPTTPGHPMSDSFVRALCAAPRRGDDPRRARTH